MSRRLVVRIVFVTTVATALVAVSVWAVPAAAAADQPRIVAIYPNPVADGDAGEFVVLSAPPDTDLGAYALGDDEATVGLPNRTASGRVVLSTDPNATARFVDDAVYPLPESLALANGGESVVLRRDGRVLDQVAYEDAPEGDVRVRDGKRRWRPLGATDRPVVTADSGEVTVFALPDAPDVAQKTLAGADRRLLLAGYTLTDGAVADELVAAARRNVTVRVLVDDSPVGGMTRQQAAVLDRLAAAGIDVRVSGGDRARYAFHHAKYAVVDDRALITTENWKRAGLGGNGSRGWGVRTDQRRVIEGLVETFRADARWYDALQWERYRKGRQFEAGSPANGSYPSRFDPRRVRVERTRLLVAPDNAEPAVLGVIGNASETLDIEQVTLGGRNQPFVRASLDAARRGVRVRILLSSAWYVEEDNRKLVAWLNERADEEGLPLEARLARPRGQFEKIHAKGVVVDGETVVLGSLNWNNNSVRQNREVVVVLEGEEAGQYFERVFEADWPVPPPLPAGLVVALLCAAAIALRVATSLRFEPPKR